MIIRKFGGTWGQNPRVNLNGGGGSSGSVLDSHSSTAATSSDSYPESSILDPVSLSQCSRLCCSSELKPFQPTRGTKMYLLYFISSEKEVAMAKVELRSIFAFTLGDSAFIEIMS